jgi:16S rRNA (cytidine1402-2'-O)-methyltransferase
MAELAKALAVLGPRLLTVGRELTKQFEEIDTLPCADLSDWMAVSPQRSRGEFALVLHPQPPQALADGALPAQAEQTLHLLLAELPLKTAVRLATDITGESKNALYQAALRWKQTGDAAD